jgi:CBS domain containing-hemolysin-like protein
MKRLLSLLRGKGRPAAEASPQSIGRLLSEAEAQGRIPPDAGHMIRRILALSETTLAEVMIPKARVTGVQASDKLSRVVETFLRTGHSRLPVYQDSFDNIVGIIHIKELLRLWGRPARNLRAVEFIRLPNFFPQTMKVAQALAEFRRSRLSVGIVIDEYGIPSGLVTAEDLVEEIVGEMSDELDREFRHHRLLGDGSYLVEASMPLEKFVEVFSCRTQSKSHSVGGMVLEELQRIPAPGEKFQLCGLDWEVAESASNRLIKLKIRTAHR